MKLLKIISASGLSLCLLCLSYTSNASHHFEAAAFLEDTRLAQVDNYIFPSNEKNYTSTIMTVNYDPKSGINGIFSPDAVYNIHLPTDSDIAKGKTFSVKFSANHYDIYELDNPNPKPGVIGKKIGSGAMGQTSVLASKIKIFAGAVKDPFFGNAISLEIFRKENLEGKYNSKVWAEANKHNVFADRKVGAIVLDIPNSLLGKDVYAFFTTDRVSKGKWEQVQYSARPLFSHTMLFDSNILRQSHDTSRPTKLYNDDIITLVSARILRGTTLANPNKVDKVAYADRTAKELIPDVMQYKVGTPTSYVPGMLNGRGLGDDVMSTMLTFLLGEPTNQKIDNQMAYTANFPYLIKTELTK